MKHRPLVALSSAAVLAVYAAGYVRTRAAADRFAADAAPRRAPAAAPPLVQAPPPLPSVQPGEPVIAPSTEQVRTRARATPRAAETETPSVPSPPSPDAAVTEPAAPPLVEPVPATPAPPAAPAEEAQFKDGTYLGWGYCRHGDIEASVVIDGGRITSATVARCLTRYSCSWIEPIYSQVVTRQSPNVDYVSGATESTDAFHDAIADALSKAK